jgi:Flp pilus assembly protein TadG
MSQILALRRKLRDAHGVTLIVVAVMLVVLLAFAALAIDIGYAAVVRNELQDVSDGAALAGARQLGAIYEAMTIPQQQAYVCTDPSLINAAVTSVGSLNQAGNVSISIPTGDIQIGDWDAATKTFTPGPNQPDAVQVLTRRDSTANGPVSTFFANVLGISAYDSRANAVAALTGTSKIEGGDLIPVGISKDWIESTPQFCGQPIKFYPSNQATGCAGWNTYTNSPAADSKLRKDILEPWVAGTYTSPEAQLPLSFEFTGGTLSNPTFDAFNNLFNKMKLLDGDGDDTAWSVFVPVYDNGTGCGNPTGSLPIAGFAAAKITAVLYAPEKTIVAQVICKLVEPSSRGGGGEYGVKGAIPGLVR